RRGSIDARLRAVRGPRRRLRRHASPFRRDQCRPLPRRGPPVRGRHPGAREVMRQVIALVLLVFTLAGCSSAPPPVVEVEPSSAEMIQIVAAATRDELAKITFTEAERLHRPPDGRMRVRVLPAVIEYRMGDRFDQAAYQEQMSLAVSQSGKGRPTDPDE